VCRDSELELGFEKIAIYTRNGLVQHVSRQLASGRWTSKMASGCDAEHVTPEILAGGCWEVSLYMRRIATGEGPQLPPSKASSLVDLLPMKLQRRSSDPIHVQKEGGPLDRTLK